MVAHPGAPLGMMGFRVLMYAGGLVSVCFYLANLRQVRTLADSAEELEQELIEGEIDLLESSPRASPSRISTGIIRRSARDRTATIAR